MHLQYWIANTDDSNDDMEDETVNINRNSYKNKPADKILLNWSWKPCNRKLDLSKVIGGKEKDWVEKVAKIDETISVSQLLGGAYARAAPQSLRLW